MAERPLYTLYKNLKAQNYDVPDDYNKFESALTRDGKSGADNRHAIYENLKAQNFDVPDTYERFYSALFEPRSKTSSRAKGGSVPMSAADRARYLSVTQSVLNTARQVKRASGNIRKTVERAKKFNENGGKVTIGFKNPLQNKNVQKNKFNYNSTTGKTGTYTTTDGVEFDNEYDASQHQNKLDKQGEQYINAVNAGEIPSVFDVRDKKGNYDLQENIGKNGTYLTEEGAQKQFDKKLEDAYARKKEIEAAIAEDHRLHGNPLLSYSSSIGASNGRTAEQSEYSNKLATSLALVKQQIGALEALKQYPTSSWGEDALKALDNTAFTAKTWDFGLTDFATMGQMERIKTKMDNNIPLSGSDKMLLKSKLGADAATALEDEKMGNVYRWTKIAGQSLPFMADFFLTGGYGGITKGISRGALKIAAKRGMGKVSAAILKNTGIVAGDVIGSYAMAGTEQAMKTGADIMQRHLGNLYQDEKGDYKFGTFDENGNLLHEGGESMGIALYKGLTSAMVENYTEKLFGHNYGIKNGAVNFMEKHGMNASAEFFKNIGKSGWYTNSKKWMEKFGINGFGEEVMEEEIGIPLHALLDGEGKVSDLLDTKQQLDIIGGMAISVGSMYAIGAGSRPVKGIYNRAQYYRFRNKVNVADIDAQNLLGDNWADIKDKIDNATNEQMGGVLADILRKRDTMTKEQINAAVNYGVNLMKMRGYNIAKTAEMNAKEITNEPTTPEEQHQADIDNAYSEGRDAYGYDTHEIQLDQEDKQKSLAQLLGISEQQLVSMSNEELESFSGRDDNIDRAIYDYQLSSARYQGVVDDAQDKVDLAAHQAAQKVDMYTDRSRGSVRNATIKASGGSEDYGVYIISGNIATYDDGSIDASNSDDMILYYDPTTNSVEHADASMFAELGEELPADEVKAQAVADAKENAIKEVAGIIDGTVEVGSQFSVTDADGTEHTYEVLADNGDGTAMITIDGNVPTELVKGENVQIPYSFAYLQQMKDEEDLKRLEAAKAEREKMEKERVAQQTQETEQTQPSFDFNQILNDDGNVVLVDVLGKDGNTKYPNSQLFLIRDSGAKAKVVELTSDGSLIPHAVNKKDVRTATTMTLDEYKQAFASSSMIEDNSGDNRGEIEAEPATIEDETTPEVAENTETTAPSDETAETPSTEQTPAITLEDGTIVPMLDDGNPDFSKMTAAQTAELYDTQFGEDADSIVSGYVSDAKKALDKANNMTVKGKTFVEQKASKDAKEKAIADAQAAYDSAIAIRDAYNERQLAKVEDTAEGRKNLIEKERRKFARLKSSVKDDAEAVAQIYKETVGSLLHRLYDSTGIDVTDTIPLTAEEYVASNLGAHSLNYEGTETSKSVKQETGLSREDFAKTQLLAADGKGTTIDALVHSLWENRPSNLDSLDTQDIRNALIGVLTSGFKASEARSFIENIRIAQAEKLIEEERTAAENAAYYEQQKAKEEEEKKKAELEKKAEEEKEKAELDGEKTNPLAERITETDEEVESDGKYGTIYNKVYLIDGDKRVTKVDEPDANGNYTGSYYMYDGKRFGDLFEVADYIDGKAEEKNFPDKLKEDSNTIEVPDDETDDAPLGKQLDESDLPFSAKENGKHQTTAERAADVEKNKVDNMKVVDNIVGQKTRKAFERLAKMMGANIQWQYSDKLGNGWIQETKDADGNVHRTIFITLDSSITEGAQFIFGHEMTHQIKNLNPAAYNELTQLVLDTYGSDSFAKAVDETMKRYSDAGFSGHNRDYYAEEVVADAVGEMIRDLNLAHTLAMKMSHPLLAAIHEILQKIKLAFFGTEYSDVTKNIIRSIEQAYVKTANREAIDAATQEGEGGQRLSLRTKPEPKKTQKVYKLMRLGEDGKLYPLFIGSGEAIELGKWYDADSPKLQDLTSLSSKDYVGTRTAKKDGASVKEEYHYGAYIVNNKTGEAMSLADFKAKYSKQFARMGNNPNKKAVDWATDNGYRWIKIEEKNQGQSRYGGEARSYYNYGINGSGSVSIFAMRPGWHAGSLPTMRQIGKGSAKNLRDDTFVWVEGEIPADIDYNEEAQKNADKDIPDHIPTDGYYLKATNANKEASQADKVGWYVAGAFRANRIMSDKETRDIIDEWNAAHPDDNVEYDWKRESGKDFNAETMSLEDTPKFSLKVYHGSGADFTEFDFDHMGEGAGSQVFGWGGYVTSSEEIGKSYTRLAAQSNGLKREGLKSNISRAQERLPFMRDGEYKTELENEIKQWQEELANIDESKNLYEVDIPDDNGSNYLEWYGDVPSNLDKEKLAELILDKTGAKEKVARFKATPAYLKALEFDIKNRINEAQTGQRLYVNISSFVSEKDASEILSSLGYTGIKYPAGTIMGGAEEGDTNYVIFKPEDMKITEHTKFSIKTYHGSQASFDKFDHSFMGSGEGAQAYGWGTYVSEVKGIAKAYAKKNAAKHAGVSDKSVLQVRYDAENSRLHTLKLHRESINDVLMLKKKNLDRKQALIAEEEKDLPKLIKTYGENSDIVKDSREFISKLKSFVDNLNYGIAEYEEKKKENDKAITEREQVLKDLEAKMKEAHDLPERNLYSVDIPDDTGENYIGWDEKMTPRMRDIRKEILEDNGYKLVDSDDIRDYFEDRDGKEYELFKEQYKTGGTFYEELAQLLHSQKLASLALKEYGFDGVKVIAQRNTGGNKEGKMNYVIFDENNAQITNHTKFSLRLKSAIDETEINPSDAQKESGNYKKGHIKFGGYDYTIENPKGSTRSGKDADGKEWKVTMHDTYGYIRGKFGKDGDHLDMFINDKSDLDNWNGDVFVVDQVNPDGSFDEHKVMYGYDSMDDAKKAYLANYSKGWQGLGNITGASKDEFDKWLDTSNRKIKPFADYAKVKFSQAQSVSKPRFSLKDDEYLKAVGDGDMEKAQKMVNEAAKSAGYSTDSSYQGTSAFNGAAPWGNGYFLTKDERKEAWDNGEFEGESTLGDYINDDIDGGNLEELTNAASYRAADPMRKEAIDNVRNAIQKKDKTITMYRSVPSDVKEGSFRNGDWVTPSRAYAVDNAKLHGWGDDYNIIEQKVPVDDVWFDGNDIAEWGYGREEDYVNDTDFAYKNTKNNRKLLYAVTYDDNGNVIPLSQRFNEKNNDVRFSLKAEKEKIVADSKANGTYMTAPNGEKTKLDAEQWATVRTVNFKNWFGDWENDPDNSSNVVDDMAEDLKSLNTPDEVDDAIKTAIDDMPSGWHMANKKMIHIAQALGENRKAEIAGEEPKFSLKDGTLIKAGTYFSGGGLVEEGLKGIIDPVVAVEYDEKISGVYRNNFGQHIVTADVRDVDPKELVKHIDGEVEYFHASPVCKNYSQAKSNHTEVELDKETAASTAEFINAIKPKVVTIENVKGYKDSDAMKTITDALDANGYTWDADVYNAADYGGYTNRERLIVRAVRDGKLPEKPKKMARKRGWYEAVADIIPTLTEKKNGVAPWMDIRLKADGIDWRNIDKPLYVMGSAYADGKIPHAFADELLPTLRTKSGDVIVMPDGKVYRAMGRVLARVSGVSDDYKMPFSENLSHIIIGNGIPTQLTEHVIAPLLTGSNPKLSLKKTNNVKDSRIIPTDVDKSVSSQIEKKYDSAIKEVMNNVAERDKRLVSNYIEQDLSDFSKMRREDINQELKSNEKWRRKNLREENREGSTYGITDARHRITEATAERELEYRNVRAKYLSETYGLQGGREISLDMVDRAFEETLGSEANRGELRALYGKARKVLVQVGAEFGGVVNAKQEGDFGFAGTDRDISLFIDTMTRTSTPQSELAHTILHEMIHQATIGAINLVKKGMADGMLTPKQIEAVNTIINTYDAYKADRRLVWEEDNYRDYGGKDEYEFAAEMADAKQRRILSIPYGERILNAANELKRVGDISLWQAIKNALRSLFEVSDKSKMDKALSDIMDDFNKNIDDISMNNIEQTDFGLNGNNRFSLRYDQFEHELNQWKKDNNLPKDAQRPTIPQRNVGESAVDFLRRVDEYRKLMALWKTAPTYEQHLLSDDTALGEFNRELQRGSVLKRIAFQDSMLAIRKAQEAIMKEVGVDRLNMAEDAYTAENRSHGKGKNEFEEYNNEFLQPLRKAYHQMKKVLGDSYDNVRIYMMAKHGLERDAQMAFRKSLEADYEDVAQRSAAYKAYKGDMNRIINDSDLEFGRVNFNTWRQRDNALRTKYSPSYMDYRYDENGIVSDYSGLSALFEGSDFEEAAYKLVKDIEDKYVTETHNLWDATNAATKKILRDGYKAGMMSKDTYQYVRDMYSHYIPLRGWDGTTADQVWDYVGGGKGAFNQTLKTAHGRTSIADDPIAYIENMAESGILLNNKNWVKQHLMLLAQNHPTSLLTLSKAWYVKSVDVNGNEEWIPATPQITSQMNSNQVKAAIDAFEQKMEKMAQTGDATQKRDGLNIAYPQTHSEEREHEVRVMKDGEEYVIYVNGDPQLAQAMNNTRAHRVREIQSGKLDRAAAWLGRKMAAAYTSLSPLFIPSNYFRDLTMTLASTAIREDARYNYLLRKNLATSWNLGFMLRDFQNGKLREKVSNGNATPKEQMFYDFMMNGGETGFVSSLDVEDLKKKFKNDLKDLDRWKANPVKVGHAIMDIIEFLNRMIEDSNRFAIYMTSIQYGRSIDEAVNDAKDVTLNFNRKGTGEYGWQMIRNLYLFINPAVQSLQTLGALGKHHPFKFTAVTASWIASGVLVPIVNVALMQIAAAFGGGDGDDKKWYKDVSNKYWQFTKWDRRNNLIMWVPFTHEFIKIPLAQEFRAFYGVGDMIASKMMGGKLAKESWSQYAEDLLGQVVDMLPLDPTGYDGNIAVSLMPNAVRPVFELAFNIDFTGKPLFKETEYNKYDPNFTKAYVGTPDWLVRASKMVNSIGNDYPEVQQNSIDAFGDPRYNLNNPAVVDHVLSSYLGGAYTMGSQVLGLLTKSLNDRKEIKMADIPVLSKFVSNPDDRPVSKKQGDEFWDKKEYYDRASNTISKLKKQAKIDGDYSLLERFYGSEEYKKYKLYEKDVNEYKEDRKKERAEESGDEYRPHQLNAEDIYKNHATPIDEFEDMKLKQLFEKLNSFKTRYDAIVDNAPNESDFYYNTNKAAIDAIDDISLDKQEISELKKGFLDDGKDAYNAEDMKQIRELRKKILAVLEKANKVVVANQKANAKKK